MSESRMVAVVVLAALWGGAAGAQEARGGAAPADRPALLERAPEGTVVFDDDGGRVQVIPVSAAPPRRLSHHGGAVVADPEAEVVFLGSAWGNEAMRAVQDRVLQHLASFGQSAQFAALARYGVRSTHLPFTGREDLADPIEAHSISDLEIQARLDALIGPGGGEADKVYVVFLAPGIVSTLGKSTGGKDYHAYHSQFHGDAGAVRYAVVPFRDDAGWPAHATAALVQTLINPEGNAWY